MILLLNLYICDMPHSVFHYKLFDNLIATHSPNLIIVYPAMMQASVVGIMCYCWALIILLVYACMKINHFTVGMREHQPFVITGVMSYNFPS